MVAKQKLADQVVDLLLHAESVDEFDEAVKAIVFGHVVPVIRRMVEDRSRIDSGGKDDYMLLFRREL